MINLIFGLINFTAMIPIIEDKISQLNELCKKFHVSSLFLFGSGAKNQLKTDSDLDFLISFNSDIKLLDYADNYFDCLDSFKKLFKKDIDLVTVKSLKNPILIQEINKTKIPVYEFESA